MRLASDPHVLLQSGFLMLLINGGLIRPDLILYKHGTHLVPESEQGGIQ